VKNGNILVGMDGDFHMCIWSNGHAYQNQRVARFEPKGEFSNFHLFFCLEKPIQELNKAIVGTTVAHLGDMHIKAIHVLWPDQETRARTKVILEPISEKIVALKRQNQNLRRTRDLLLPRLLAGQLDVGEVERSPFAH
jgi:type I restriction enzyme S subunit